MDREKIGQKIFAERVSELEADETENERTIRFVASDETVDRYGDVVSADGWDLAHFKKNPIFLWGHNYDQPIGKVVKVGVEDNRLMATARLARKGTTQFIDDTWNLIKEKVVNAVSVGFMVHSEKDYEPIRDQDERTTGLHFLRQELLEISLVAVPANPSALLVARAQGLTPDSIKRFLRPDASVQAAADVQRRRVQAMRVAALRHSSPR
jgi:HK97 family phage prohead protease